VTLTFLTESHPVHITAYFSTMRHNETLPSMPRSPKRPSSLQNFRPKRSCISHFYPCVLGTPSHNSTSYHLHSYNEWSSWLRRFLQYSLPLSKAQKHSSLCDEILQTLCKIVVKISSDRRMSLREWPSYEMSRCAVWQKCTNVSDEPVSIIHPHDRGIRFLWNVGTLLPGYTK